MNALQLDGESLTQNAAIARSSNSHERARRQRQAAKMQAMGRQVAEVAHDLNNIFCAVLGFCDLTRNKLPEASSARENIDDALRAAARGRQLVEGILALSRRHGGVRAPVRIRDVVEEAIRLLEVTVGQRVGVHSLLYGADAMVIGDSTQIHRVVTNLCTNAAQAIQDEGVVTLALTRARIRKPRDLSHGRLEGGSYVQLAVSDTGAGIAPGAYARLFEPFFTTKKDRSGTGLGLALVRAIVEDLGGAINVATTLGEGSTFTIWLPVVSDREIASVAVRPRPRHAGVE
jgi:signal transduction histidine kinase